MPYSKHSHCAGAPWLAGLLTGAEPLRLKLQEKTAVTMYLSFPLPCSLPDALTPCVPNYAPPVDDQEIPEAQQGKYASKCNQQQVRVNLPQIGLNHGICRSRQQQSMQLSVNNSCSSGPCIDTDTVSETCIS